MFAVTYIDTGGRKIEKSRIFFIKFLAGLRVTDIISTTTSTSMKRAKNLVKREVLEI